MFLANASVSANKANCLSALLCSGIKEASFSKATLYCIGLVFKRFNVLNLAVIKSALPADLVAYFKAFVLLILLASSTLRGLFNNKF